MSSRELARALELVRREPENVEATLALIGMLRRLGRPPPDLSRTELPLLNALWRAQPHERGLEGIVLPLLRLEPHDEAPPELPEHWRVRGRAKRGETGWYCTRSGFPLSVRREVDGAVMVLVPAGDFVRGSDETEDRDTNPPHRVTLESYYLDREPITRARFDAFRQWMRGQGRERELHLHASWDRSVRDDPQADAIWVRWNDAASYSAWVGGRIPTEAELAKAMRGTDGRRYPWGDNEPLLEAAEEMTDEVFRGLEAIPDQAPGPLGAILRGVLQEGADVDRVKRALRTGLPGSRDASPFGLAGARSRLYCWSADWSGDAPFQEQPAENPRGIELEADFETMAGAARRKVARRGSPLMPGEGTALPVFGRGHFRPTFHNPEVGFRVAMSVQRPGDSYAPPGERKPRRLRRRRARDAGTAPFRALADLLRRF